MRRSVFAHEKHYRREIQQHPDSITPHGLPDEGYNSRRTDRFPRSTPEYVNVNLSEYKPIDIVGTGGDGKNTFNISTCACFVVAGAGYKVAKHGNYGATSVSGASNVMEEHGVKFTNDPSRLRKSIWYICTPLSSIRQ